MSAWWVAPLALTALSLAWYAVQRAWLAAMARPASDDALARPGCAGPDGRGCTCGPGRDDRAPPATAQHSREESPS